MLPVSNPKKAKKRKPKGNHIRAYPFEFRLKVVKFYREEGYRQCVPGGQHLFAGAGETGKEFLTLSNQNHPFGGCKDDKKKL